MNQDSGAALLQNLPDDVPSLMLPFLDKTLLVPTVTVAEVVGYRKPEQIDEAPDWLLGVFAWRDQRVPMMSLELLTGQPLAPVGELSRVAIFNYTGVSEELPFLAVPTVGIPKLARVTADELVQEEAGPANVFEKARVKLNGDSLIIPEISALEQAYLSWKQGQV